LMMNPAKRTMVQALAGGSAGSMPNISKARLNRLALELPPIALQERFAEKLSAVSGQRGKLESEAEQLDALLASLQARAFRGEL
ncbi:MAG: hypothetical protein Q4G46_02675, partial [Propionibacteriaceae bacterium]|nr:hypothetical protein [Propionibacteriaceae bacterium]